MFPCPSTLFIGGEKVNSYKKQTGTNDCSRHPCDHISEFIVSVMPPPLAIVVQVSKTAATPTDHNHPYTLFWKLLVQAINSFVSDFPFHFWDVGSVHQQSSRDNHLPKRKFEMQPEPELKLSQIDVFAGWLSRA